jgi:Domain of unknown function (DUF4209)
MTEEIAVPAAIDEVLYDFNGREVAFTELGVYQALAKARTQLKDIPDDQNLGAWSEIMAFSLMPDRSGRGPWKTYFGPMSSGTKADGTAFYGPDIADAPPLILEHWAERAASLTAPVLQARYADLVWDMAPAIAGTRRDPAYAQMAIDAYFEAVSTDRYPDAYARKEPVLRALDLAIALRDDARTDATRSALLAFHREAIQARKVWWIAYDRLESEKRAGVTDEHRQMLVNDLETLLAEFSDAANPNKFNPHGVEEIATRLVRHYTRARRHEDVKRLHRKTGEAFEHFAGLANPMLAATVLQTAVNAYRNAGMGDHSRRARRVMEDKIAASRDEMQPITFEMKVCKEDMDAFLTKMVVDNLGQCFANIASALLARKAELENMVAEGAKAGPISAHINSMVMAEDHVAARIGSVDEDPYGRLLQEASRGLAYTDLYLWAALEKTMEVHDPKPQHFVAWANRLDLFDDVTFLVEGVKAWMQGDLTKAVHVLVPQIEHGLRRIADKLGEPVTKQHRKLEGVGVSIGMGDMLNGRLAEALGPDLTIHFLALYADARGRNFRNRVAHGLLKPEDLSPQLCRLLIHTLLLFGIWEQLAGRSPPTTTGSA